MTAKTKKSNFLADVWYELTTKVVWPTWGRLKIATIVVVGFIIFWALLLYGFDVVFTTAQDYLTNDAVVQKQWNDMQAARQPVEGEVDPETGLPIDTELPEGVELPEGIPTPGTDQ